MINAANCLIMHCIATSKCDASEAESNCPVACLFADIWSSFEWHHLNVESAQLLVCDINT